jgi:hypothetical protein
VEVNFSLSADVQKRSQTWPLGWAEKRTQWPIVNLLARWAILAMGDPGDTFGLRGALRISVVKELSAKASNTLRRREIGTNPKRVLRRRTRGADGSDPVVWKGAVAAILGLSADSLARGAFGQERL